jgi:hypothetical protein
MRAHRPERLARRATSAAALEEELPLIDAFPKEILVAHTSPLPAGAVIVLARRIWHATPARGLSG